MAYFIVQTAIYIALGIVLSRKGIGFNNWEFYFVVFCVAASQSNYHYLAGE